jgi:galactokinase
MEGRDAAAFGRVMSESHASLHDGLGVSHPELDRTVECAIAASA